MVIFQICDIPRSKFLLVLLVWSWKSANFHTQIMGMLFSQTLHLSCSISISSTEIRCLVDVPGQKEPSISNGELAQYLKTVVAPQIPAELCKAFISAIDKRNIRTMPNRSMLAATYPTPGALLLGDAFNMRHPLTGGGMTVVLSDIVVLRDLLRPLQ
ncbi:hypothetical protein F0562_020835 [Nyssa sinensis]|uniref:Squalene monooxygenase n=1 Tax=Nyssa sinensis TaxID=561372 RepID=A0A5J5BSM6_9ASTE|nr:hypothetical protein F0562_020835 [Nyssa sinensis]